ncbi:glycoside hydrolase family 36 protein [Massiliimalia timonensis]|uniref:glycoside hydrolase family 36 protein n=1 Tax=Massiliimalia timonensis TaxID=1987501 RepID=UPI000B8A6337|nr:glycoside hydrolase family 36 protein [Massiliimalia timonensis]
MSKPITVTSNSLRVDFLITGENCLTMQGFAPVSRGEAPVVCASPYLSPIEIYCTGEMSDHFHGYKHYSGGTSARLQYESRRETQNGWGKKLEFTLSSPEGLEVVYHIQFFNEINIVRTWADLTNRGTQDISLEYVSSFRCPCLCTGGKLAFPYKTEVYLPQNSWCCEAQWKKFSIEELGISRMLVDGYNSQPGVGTSRFHYGSYGSWSSADYLPMGMAEDTECGEIYYWQIESSCGWEAEYTTVERHQLSLTLSGPTENEGHWHKSLKPGDTFQTVTASCGVTTGSVSEAAAELTKYRRAIRRPNEDDRRLNLVFNDFMNCLDGDPTEEKELPMIDLAADLGCEYYCIDAGWYDKGYWWDRVGEWKESPERFPHGLKHTLDYVRKKGMKPGLWIEIEVMGTACELASQLPDDWFFQRGGKRHIDNKRYLLDFRNPAVRNYATSVIDRLILDYGVEFFKVDYNVTTLFGSEYQSDSCGDALLEHVRALYGWYAALYRKYPFLVIENCGSGGMRMDYGMLQGQSLQSTSDQTDYCYNAYIAANAASAVTPEQAGMWVYPYEDEEEHVLFNMVNGLLLRPYISGKVWALSQPSLDRLREGITLYKRLRPEIAKGLPFFPLGFADIRDAVLSYGLRCGKKCYLSVFFTRQQDAEIPLPFDREPVSVKVIYPKEELCAYQYQNGTLTVHTASYPAARLFEFTL